MSRFLDVTSNKWYYNEIVEASNILLEDGKPLIEGIPYNVFESEKPYVYQEFKATAGQTEFTLNKAITPSPDNPLFVYVGGVQTVYKDISTDGSTTKVTLYQGVPENTIVAFASYGVPKVDEFGRPSQANSANVSYPNKRLSGYANYYYNPFYRDKREYVSAFGKYLRRANITQEEWDVDPTRRQEVLRKHIGYNSDVYFIAPDGVLHVPYNMNGVTCKVTYLTNENGYIKVNTEEVTPTTETVLHLNRVFPDAYITRAEAFVLIDRLRRTFYSRFSDTKAATHKLDITVEAYEGQRAFSVPGWYEVGKNDLEVYLNDKKQKVGIDYEEYDGYTIVFKNYLNEGDKVRLKSERNKSLRLEDVGTRTKYYRVDKGTYLEVNGTVGNEDPRDDSWWAPHILALEKEMLSTGELMVTGIPIRESTIHEGLKTVHVNSVKNPIHVGGDNEFWFMPNTFITRAESVTILNRFRKLMMERFL